MKKTIFIFALVLVSLCAIAQPKWAKKASKAVFTLKTFADDGTLKGSSNGFFISQQGMAVSSFAPFKGASRAVIIDADGKEYEVSSIVGGNDIYDIAKFQVSIAKTSPLEIATTPAGEGEQLWILAYAKGKAGATKGANVRKVESAQEDYKYYTLGAAAPENSTACPLINEAGQVVAIMQQSVSGDSLCYAVSANFPESLKTTALSINDATLATTSIKLALPDEQDQATLMIYLASGKVDSTRYASMVDDYIEKFPHATDGYSYKATMEINAHNFAAADKLMAQAVSNADNKDEAQASFARLIYQKELAMPELPYEPWTLDVAADKADKAYQTNPLPTYLQLKADIRFAQKKYDEAYSIYETLIKGDAKTTSNIFSAAACKKMMGDTLAAIALADSAMATLSKPYLKEAAPYILNHAQMMIDFGKYRDAVNDYNDYEQLMATSVNDRFYYLRHQAELSGKLYQQALNDINKAIDMAPSTPLYYAEKASLQVRVGMTDDAIATADTLINLDSNNSDGYLFKGLAQCLKGNKAEGVANLEKAKSLGDQQADTLIEKYGK